MFVFNRTEFFAATKARKMPLNLPLELDVNTLKSILDFASSMIRRALVWIQKVVFTLGVLSDIKKTDRGSY